MDRETARAGTARYLRCTPRLARGSLTAGFGACLVVAFATPLAAADATYSNADPSSDSTSVAAGFLTAHPDLKFRRWGQDALARGEAAQAHHYFLMAARYADKPSQAMLGEMAWNGTGVAKNRAEAYAWLDLAAERGYPALLAVREQYWAALTPEERAAAVDVGRTMYAEYGDPTAGARIAEVLRSGKKQISGSRLGNTGSMRIVIPGGGGVSGATSGITVDAVSFHDDQFWDAAKYRAWHDRVDNPAPGRQVALDGADRLTSPRR